ncbi:MAG: hypothetical protein OER86_06865, partial [Phycisphaerae bacterium]|nr:hypothetical protein [Phycisphaerae bacterium]
VAMFVLGAWLMTEAKGYKGDGFGSEATQILLQAVVGAAMMIGTVFLGTRLMEIPAGAVGPMALKTAGVYLFAASLGSLISLTAGDAGWFLGALVLLAVQIGLFMWFFAMDFLSAWIFAAIGYLIKELVVVKMFGGTL